MVIFPWEVEFYKKYGIDVVYYGNPFIEKYPLIKNEGDKILLLPGSRKQEVTSLLPVMLDLVENNKKENFLLKLPDKKTFKWVSYDLTKYKNLEVSEESLEDVVKKSKIAVAASGTVTLELAIMGLPAVVVYKTTFLNYLIAKYILKVKYISLPNLTENKEVYPELIGKDCNEKNILSKIKYMLENISSIKNDIKEIRKKLYGEEITKNYGDYILKGNKYVQG